MSAVLAFGGGEVWVMTSYPVWILGSLLALHAGWLCGVALVGTTTRIIRQHLVL